VINLSFCQKAFMIMIVAFDISFRAL